MSAQENKTPSESSKEARPDAGEQTPQASGDARAEENEQSALESGEGQALEGGKAQAIGDQESPPESSAEKKELTEEERIQLGLETLRKGEALYRQRIEDAKSRIRLRGEVALARRQGHVFRYTVREGDTPEEIAKLLYGNASRWPQIQEANKDVLPDPEALQPGQELIIP